MIFNKEKQTLRIVYFWFSERGGWGCEDRSDVKKPQSNFSYTLLELKFNLS